MKIFSFAKINLYLDITGVDNNDGYHYIDSVFQEISLYDEIDIKKTDGERDIIKFSGFDIKGETTVHRALSGFKKKFGIRDNYSIQVKKNIPMGAGLGGGSSNAAYVLLALSGLYGIDKKQILDISLNIGSDVPFYLYGGIRRVKGKGEVVEDLPGKLKNVYFLIVYPNIHVSTSWAYSLIDNYGNSEDIDSFFKNSVYNIDFLKNIVYNRFQGFILDRNRGLAMKYKRLSSILTPDFSLMTGSGSSFVFAYDNEKKARVDHKILLQESGIQAFYCKPIYRSA